MSFFDFLSRRSSAQPALPAALREMVDIRGVRVVRLQGPVGKEAAVEAEEVRELSQRTEGGFSRPLLLDFAGTTGWDFSTVSYMVLALRRRVAAGVPVGIINAPP